MGLGLGIRSKLSHVIAKSPVLKKIALKVQPRSRIFRKAYHTRVWDSDESHSGRGSELGATEALRIYLPTIFDRLHIKTFLDAPCGDWNWMREVDLSKVDYIGADIVSDAIERNRQKYQKERVKFIVADLTKDELPQADLILCRDCWVHVSFEDIADIIENFRRSRSEYLLVSNSPHVQENKDKLTGLDWRHINLKKAPFNFPDPLDSFKDHYDDTPFFMSLWRIEDLPVVKDRGNG